ncbi:unnamed protein product [Rodentolepis nana]|uniref:Uncharacterized protein n=1 Tax=Rodentolepis nana TaxID=102285 RepID=A0A0R3TAU6_RODNA|nr:unnamed protein product [Rodentolepis nana]
MGFSFTGLGVSLALLVVVGAIIYYCWFRKKKTVNRGPSEGSRQDNFINSGSEYPPSTHPTTAPHSVPVGWNVNPNTSASKTAPYPTGGVSGTAPYPTGGVSGTVPYPTGGVSGTAPYPTGGVSGTAPYPTSGGIASNPSAPPPYSSPPPPYPS